MRSKKRIIVYCTNYPSEKNLYGDVFVQSRLLKYKEYCDILVVGYGEENKYTYLGIDVEIYASKEELWSRISNFKADVLAIHFYSGTILGPYMETNTIPTFVWVHGFEALGWYRRLFLFKIKETIPFLRYILGNVIQLYLMRKLIKHSNLGKNIKFVFVSNWMKKIAEHDMFIAIKKFEIIPNPIDISLFAYHPKTADMRNKILLIRSFDSYKYANDIAIKALLIVAKKSFFNDLEITICGKGIFFDSLTEPLRKYSNVTLINEFIPNTEISKYHKSHGVFLCPTRQDSQGVSMCEAMSSGLVPITSDNTAIPEFVNADCGYLTTSATDIAKAVEELYNNPSLFLMKSINASKHITELSSNTMVVEKELKIMFND